MHAIQLFRQTRTGDKSTDLCRAQMLVVTKRYIAGDLRNSCVTAVGVNTRVAGGAASPGDFQITRGNSTMKHDYATATALALLLSTGSQVIAAAEYGTGGQTAAQPSGPMGQPGQMMGRGMGGPGMMGQPGMMMGRGMGRPGMMGQGFGTGPMSNATPAQRQQHWDQMRAQGYGPGTMRYMTPEQRQQHWEQMRQQGYGPGAMGYMSPEQRQQHLEQMREQGYGPGAMGYMTPEQRQQHLEQMRQQGYGPGSVPAPVTK